MPAHRRYRFGDCMLDVVRGSLLKGEVEVRLRPKSFAVLQVLVERHGELVTKEELLEQVWGRTVVTDGAITQCLIDVRRAIGDTTQQMVRTLPRRGYVFAAPVVAVGDEFEEARTGEMALPAAPAPRKTYRAQLVAAAAVLVVLAAGIGWWNVAGRKPAPPPAVAADSVGGDRNSIAVLPFVNLTDDPEGEYFSDGVSEEIVHLLAQADGLRVIARTSSFAFKGQRVSIHDIAARLGVAYVVEGSVRRSGSNLRVTAQLIDAASSSHVWSKAYERDVRDLLEVQQDIAQHVAVALEASLVRGARPSSAAVDPGAHDAFLRARFFFNRRLPDDLLKAQRAYEEALSIDPQYARAWAGLAGVYHVQIREPGVDVAALLRKRQYSVETALTQDPGLAEAHIRAAMHYLETGDPTRAAEQAAIAYELAPTDPAVLNWRASDLAWQGRLYESIAIERRVVASDPVSRVARVNFANALLSAGRLDEARAEFERYLEMTPGPDPDVAVDMARLLLLEGRNEEALAEAQRWAPGPDRDFVLAAANDALQRRADGRAAEARLRRGGGPVEAVRLAELLAHRSDADQAFAWIDAAHGRLGPNAWFSPNWQWLYQLRFSPFFRPLHADPRWPAAAKRTEPQPFVAVSTTRDAPKPAD